MVRIATIIMLLVGGGLYAQQEKLCDSDETHAHLRSRADYRQNELQYDRFIRSQAKTTTTDTIIIPTVVHVIHMGVGTASYVSVGQIDTALRYLHEDLRNLPGSRAWGRTPDRHIEFQLASKDPQGNPTTGVVYLEDADLSNLITDTQADDPQAENYLMKSASRWDSTKYCNIWIVSRIESGGGLLAGFAQYPWDPRAGTDGVTVRAGRLSGNQGYDFTLTHEIGHYLGLIHPFDSMGCVVGDCNVVGDKVCDTAPSVAGFKSGGQRYNFCEIETPQAVENPLNYMDYNQISTAPNYFSAGQMDRFVGTMNNQAMDRRSGLWSDSNLQATGCGKYGTVRAYFYAKSTRTRPGQPVTFQEYCQGQPHKFTWYFDGADTPVSTSPSPTISWSSPGTYTVKLVAENAAGNKDSLTRELFIEVDNATQNLFAEYFFDTSIPTGWRVVNQDNKLGVLSKSWSVNAGSGADGAGDNCLIINQFFNQNQGTFDWLESPVLDLSSVASPYFEFLVAYRPLRYENTSGNFGSPIHYDATYTDTLRVQVSDDMGQTWTTLWVKGGDSLSTLSYSLVNSLNNAQYQSPQPSAFRKETINLESYKTKPVLLRFEAENNRGNNIFLDNITLTSLTANKEAKGTLDARLWPNPATNYLNLEVVLEQEGEFQIRNVQGQLIHRETLAPRRGKYTVSLEGVSAGYYYCHIISDNSRANLKVVKY